MVKRGRADRSVLRRLTSNSAVQNLFALLIFLMMLAGGEMLVRMDSTLAREEQHCVVTARVADLRARLENELASTIFLTSGVVAYAGSSERLDDLQAQRLIRAIYSSGRNIRNVLIAPDNKVRWIYPLQGNEKILGMSYPSLTSQWPEVQRAIAERRTVLAGPLDLVQGGRGIVARTPVFLSDGHYWGLVSLTIDWDKLLRRINLAQQPADIRLAIRGRDGKGKHGDVFFGDQAVFAAHPVLAKLELPGGSWIIAATPSGGWDAESPHQGVKRAVNALLALGFTLMLLAILHDASERRRINRELRLLNASLEQRVAERTAEIRQANDELSSSLAKLQKTQDSLVQSEKLAALGSLVAGVAHEMNTPVGNSLLAASTLGEQVRLLRDAERPLSRRAWQEALTAIEEASTIIERSLTRASELVASFKQVAADGTSSQRRVFDLQKAVHDFLLVLQPAIKRSGVEVQTAIPPGLQMDSYPGMLEQVLMNLIQNAITHAFPEQRAGKIRIGAHALGENTLVIWVADDGRGIPAENLPKVFDPFFTTKMGQGGTGLGLNIAYNLVTGPLGGHIEVSSNPGEGACFELTLPLSAPRPS